MRVKTFDKSMSLVCTHENQGVFHVILQTSYCSSYTKKLHRINNRVSCCCCFFLIDTILLLW